MVHEAAGLAVRRVDRTQEAPGLRQQLPDRRRPHLGEGGSSVDAAEVRQVADEVQLVGHDAQARVLQHAETWRTKRPLTPQEELSSYAISIDLSDLKVTFN